MLLENYIKLLLEAPQVKLGDLTKHPGKVLLGKEYKSYWELSNDEFKTFYPQEDLSKRGPFFNCMKLCFDEFLSYENDPEFDVAEHIREMIIYINALYDNKGNENVSSVYSKFIADGYNGFEELKNTYESLYEHIGSKNLNIFNNPSYITLIKNSQTQYLFDTPNHIMNGLLCVIPSTVQSSVFWARTNARAQKLVLDKTNPAQSSDPDYLQWCTARTDESNMFNSYFIRGGTSLFYFLPVDDLEGTNKFCIGVTKLNIENDNQNDYDEEDKDKNFKLICGGHTTVGFENAAFIPDNSEFDDNNTQKIILNKFGKFGLTKEMLDIIIEKSSGRNPFDKYAYIGGLKPAEFAATVNMNTIGQTEEGRNSIKNQIESILEIYKDPEFLKQYIPNPKILTIVNKDIRYFTVCGVSFKFLDQKYSNDINFWDSVIDNEISKLESGNARQFRFKSMSDICESLSKTNELNIKVYKYIVEKVKNSVIDKNLQNKISGSFLLDFFSSIPLDIKLKANQSELKDILNIQLDIFKKFTTNNNLFSDIQDLILNENDRHEVVNSLNQIPENILIQIKTVLNKLFNNFNEFFNLMKDIYDETAIYTFRSLKPHNLILSSNSDYLIPSTWLNEESFHEYIATIMNSNYKKNEFIKEFLRIIEEDYNRNYSRFYDENKEFSNYVLIVIMQEIYFDEVLNRNEKRNYEELLSSSSWKFNSLVQLYEGFKRFLKNNEMFQDFSNELQNFKEDKNDNSLNPRNQLSKEISFICQNLLRAKNNESNYQASVQLRADSINAFRKLLYNLIDNSSNLNTNTINLISNVYKELEGNFVPELYSVIEDYIFNPNQQKNPFIWVELFIQIFENTNTTKYKFSSNDHDNIYSAKEIVENRKNNIDDLSYLNDVFDKYLNNQYEDIIIQMIRKFGYDSEQKVINLFYKVFPSYEKMPDSARDIFDQLLDYDSVTYNPWTGEGEINEVKRKYILGNKILTEVQLKKLIRHLL